MTPDITTALALIAIILLAMWQYLQAAGLTLWASLAMVAGLLCLAAALEYGKELKWKTL